MKRTIFVIAFLMLLIGIPILTEANDTTEFNYTTEVNLLNPILQKQEVKLPWYKNIDYTFGYNGGLCWVGKDLNYYTPGIYDPPFSRIVGRIYWLNSIEAGVRIPTKNRIIDVGLGYGMENIIGDSHFKYYNFRIGRLRKIYLYLSYSNPKLNNVIPGLELNYSPIYGTEYYYDTTGVLEIPNIRRDLIGGGIYLKFCNTRKNKKRSRFDPYFMIKIAGSHEIYNTSPYSDLRKNKLNVWYMGIYEGFNLNITGRNETNYFHTNGRTNDSIEVNLNPALQKQELKLPWYKNMNYTFGYNLGLCLRGSDLNYYPHGGVDIVGNIVGKFYWLNSIEAGVRIPINNRMLDVGLGYGWGNMEDLTIKHIYTYIANSTLRNLVSGGLELDYFQGNRTEYHTIPGGHISVPNVRRDFVGGGCYIKLSPTITLNKSFGINPYFMIKIGKVYEIHSTSPYHELDKKLTIWFTGLYGGFNLNIGGKR